MQTLLIYALTAIILPIAVVWAMPAALSPALMKIKSKPIQAVCFFITGLLSGFLILWFSIMLFDGMGLPVSVMIPLVLMLPMLAWCGWRVYKNLAADTFIDELACALGEILGIVAGIGIFFD